MTESEEVEVLDWTGFPIVPVLPGYRIIPGFEKYEINRDGVVCRRNVHRPLQSARGPESWVSLSNEKRKPVPVKISHLRTLAFPNDEVVD